MEIVIYFLVYTPVFATGKELLHQDECVYLLGIYISITINAIFDYDLVLGPHFSTGLMKCADRRQLSQIAKFMGPTWGPSGADRTQVGPMLAP